jgi:hypothetical protein
MQHGYQNEPPKKGEHPNDPQNKHVQRERSRKQDHNDSKETQRPQGVDMRP